MKTHNRQCYLLLAAVALNALSAIQASPGEQEIGSGKPEKKGEPMNNPTAPEKIIEILTLDIKPGRRDEFHKRYVTNSVPLLKKWNFNLVAYGPSLHDANSYYVIRAFKSLEERQVSEDAFYNSTDWKQGPRNAILELVDHFSYAAVSSQMWKKVAESGL
jgi:hypothetical protein